MKCVVQLRTIAERLHAAECSDVSKSGPKIYLNPLEPSSDMLLASHRMIACLWSKYPMYEQKLMRTADQDTFQKYFDLWLLTGCRSRV